MALFGNGVDKATAEVRKLRDARVSFEEKELAAREEAASIERLSQSGALESLLDPGNDAMAGLMSQRRKRSAVLNDELTSLALARPQVLKRLEEALRAVNVARANDLRKQAEKLQRELSTHQAESDRLRLLLETHEECGFIPDFTRATVQPTSNRGEGVMEESFRIPHQTKGQTLFNRIAGLEAEAKAIEARMVNAGGAVVDKPTLEELLQAVAGIEDIAPSERTIRAWAVTAFADAEREWKKLATNFPGEVLERDLSITLQWGPNGAIVDGSNVIFRRRVAWKRVPGIMSSSFA